MGRDQKHNQLTQAEMAKALADERARIAAIGPQVRDRFGKPIQEGSFVLFMPALPILYRVDRMTINLDPNVAPGIIELELTAKLPYYVQQATPVDQLVLIGNQPTQAQRDAMEKEKQAAQQAEAPQETTLETPGTPAVIVGPRLVLTDNADKQPEEPIDGQSEK